MAMKFLRTRLASNMFLEFATWGVWLPILGNHLSKINFSNSDISLIFGTGALATIAAPLLAGQFSDPWLRAYPGRPVGDCFYFAALYAGLQGVLSFFLPHTPPDKKSKKKFAMGEAFAMMKEPSYAVFVVLAFFLMFVLNFYYVFAGKFFEEGLKIPASDVSTYLNIGQFAEIFTLMLLVPVAHKKLGTKWTIGLGI